MIEEVTISVLLILPVDRKEHLCDIAGCDMAFKTVYNLRDHKRIYHYHMLRYACDICGK